MKITITGSLGHIGRRLTEILTRAGQQVTLISSQPKNREAIAALGATPAIGSVNDAAFLRESFRDAEAVFTMVPPNFGVKDMRKHIGETVQLYASVIQDSGITRVVNLSSIGAHLTGGTGPIAGLHDGEISLNALGNVAVRHLRPAFFYTNFLGNIEMIRRADILGSNYPADIQMVMVHPHDIAEVAAEELQQPFSGKSVRYIASDVRGAGEVARLLGAAIGKAQLPWVEFTDEQSLQGMKDAGMSPEIAAAYVEMGTAVRSNALWSDYIQHKPAVLGKTKLEDFAREFASVYHSSEPVAAS
jgi:uncharacterized protein YbjT (DUF2867 family)